MKRVVAQGTFDILHPGHVHYLREAASMGDELHVIVARSSNVTHKAGPVIPDEQRVEMVGALDPVDVAHLGHPEDIFVPIKRIEPDIIVLGHDQYHSVDELEAELAERGIECELRRGSPRQRDDEFELLSTGDIIDCILKERG